jgi:hypothetical protein
VKLSKADLLRLHVELQSLADADGLASISIRGMAERLGFDEDVTSFCFFTLRKAGAIIIERKAHGPNNPNVYRIRGTAKFLPFVPREASTKERAIDPAKVIRFAPHLKSKAHRSRARITCLPGYPIGA